MVRLVAYIYADSFVSKFWRQWCFWTTEGELSGQRDQPCNIDHRLGWWTTSMVNAQQLGHKLGDAGYAWVNMDVIVLALKHFGPLLKKQLPLSCLHQILCKPAVKLTDKWPSGTFFNPGSSLRLPMANMNCNVIKMVSTYGHTVATAVIAGIYHGAPNETYGSITPMCNVYQQRHITFRQIWKPIHSLRVR